MFLKKLKITNFRNHSQTELSFKARLIFFIGNNGEGKTNILESISLLSHLKSFRESDDDHLVKWKNDFLFLKADYEAGGDETQLEFGFELFPQKRRKIKVNGETIKKKSDMFGIFKCVVFSPPDLQIIDFGNEERRKFVDSFISSLDREYLENLLEYNRLLKQRNAALKLNSSLAEIKLWNEPLASRAEFILLKRKDFIFKLNEYFKKNLMSLSQEKDNFDIKYDPSSASKEILLTKLSDNIRKDLALGYTSSGIHRDKIPIGFEDKDLSSFGSQGQKRSAVIALKTGTFQMITDYTGEMPVLLIDDIIRELDVKRREYFVNLISKCGQAFFTTTDLDGMQDYIGNLPIEKEIYQVQSGKVSIWGSE